MVQVKDPVCGMMVESSTGRKERISDHEYCFCSDDCMNRFRVNPGRYMA